MRAIVFVCALLLVGQARAGESPINFLLEQGKRHAMSIFTPSKAVRKIDMARIVRASWYGGGERLNRFTSTGEVFRPWARTAAHRSLAFGTQLEIVNLANGRTTVVRVNDRGPAAYTGRDLDLSRGAASDLKMISAGEARVSYRVLSGGV